MKMPLLLGMGCCAAIAAAAQAADYPNIRAGLWSTTTTIQDGKLPPQTGTMCNSTAVMQSVIDAHKKATDQPCRITSMTHDGSVYTEETECTIGGHTRKSTSVTTFTGDNAVHTEIHQADGSVTVTSDSRYVGSCPAGMVPGDYVGADGMKLNILHPEEVKLPDDAKTPDKTP